MSDNVERIRVRDFDPATETLVLEDMERVLSSLMMPLSTFNEWRIDQHTESRSRFQLYMVLIKKQGGKQTIHKQIAERRESKFYKDYDPAQIG